jgi:hypothetical protein
MDKNIQIVECRSSKEDSLKDVLLAFISEHYSDIDNPSAVVQELLPGEVETILAVLDSVNNA